MGSGGRCDRCTVHNETIEDGWIMATVPDLPGAVRQGQDMDEARSNIREVLELLLASYREHAFQHASPHVVREMVTINGYDDTNPQ